MAKFCGKCGSKLDETTGLCPKCDADQLRAQEKPAEVSLPDEKKEIIDRQEAAEAPISKKEAKKAAKKKKKADKKTAKKAKKKAKRATMTTGQKVRSFFAKLLLTVLLLAIILAGAVVALTYWNILDIPAVSDFIYDLENGDASADIEKDIPETDTTGFEYYYSSEENIVVDEGIMYVNNELLVTLLSEDSRPDLEQYLSSVGGKIVGEITEFAEYQVLLDQPKSMKELTSLIEDLETFDWVLHASPNYAMEMDCAYTPNDKKWKGKWGDIPEGDNWGMEAIDAPGAWEYKDQLQTVNIGIFDTMFDVNHADLNFEEEPLGNVLAWESQATDSEKNHGTHVAGTVAAEFDNNCGVSGVSIKTNLFGVALRGMGERGTVQCYKIALYYLVVYKKCSVVNISLGQDLLSFNASRHCKLAEDELQMLADCISEFIRLLIDDGYQFVICTSAGNQNEVGGGYQYFLKDSDDTENHYDYLSYTDYKKYLDGKGDKDAEKKYSRYKDKVEQRLESGNVDAKYSLLGAIADERVKKRIIMVGAVKTLGTHKDGLCGLWGSKIHDGYTIAAFSQCGSRVDVIAPGVDIQSMVKGGYALNSGTSMSSPHVAGVAGLIFAANPDIKADAVKQLIKDTAVGSYGSEKYGLVNAKNAVEAALNYETTDDDQTDSPNLPSQAVEYDSHHYKVFEDSLSWNDAKTACEKLGGHLVVITSEDEEAFIEGLIQSGNQHFYWLGGTDAAQESDWTWVTGEPWNYTNWDSGEPKNESGIDGNEENYLAIDRKKNAWNDAQGGGDPSGDWSVQNAGYICEWDDHEAGAQQPVAPVRTTSDERDIVLVLDVSGSMSGTPVAETQKAATKFIDTVLDEDASIGVVTYDDTAHCVSDFSTDKTHLESVVNDIYSGGGTNIDAGLAEAQTMLSSSHAKKKIIVLMSDGEPNNGRVGDELVAYSDEIKAEHVMIYTLGFFESMGDGKSSAQILMERIASDGCHYEVANADDLVFFFNDMADQINGQKYIYVRIACPVDVTVSYNGQTLSSAEGMQNLRTDFGTLTFEEGTETYDTSQTQDDSVKILRLKDEAEYDLKLEGTGRGVMNYTIGFMDDNGDYSDLRKFRNIKITRRTEIDTVAALSKESILNIDEDGDGKYDLRLRAEANGYGKEIKQIPWPYFAVGGGVLVLIVVVIMIGVHRHREKKRKV